jgi:putative cell wall-binding protein
VLVPPLAADASPSDPAQWPAFPGADAELTATAHTIRFAGPDRYQTNLALDLALRGNGDFPFDTSDRTSGGASGLAQADDWWGAASCPRSIIVVAGDTFADALAAASLSDPTDRSGQPRVQRVAAQDPLFDPIGGFDRPDTAYAPIVVTTSARSGAKSLAPTARVTASDLSNGGCTTAKDAIIVGGASAVPTGVESELIGIGYREVFRVAGADRYETAARVAAALGSSEPTSETCDDPAADDGSTRLGWYGNAVAEYRFDATSCRLLPRSVVLADGGTGADALAAGWWTSHWQVPILLTAPDGSLPQATRVALQTLDIDTVIVLGGVARIPESTVDEARVLAGATVGRIAGANRTETSIKMAQAFGGWHPTGVGADFADDIACFAASSGSGAEATGWPDALAAGPVCARLGVAGGGSPVRALRPVTGAAAATAQTGGRPGAHDAVPVIVLPADADALPASVVDFLGSAFPASATWCSGTDASSGCLGGGFGVVVGGERGIGRGIVDDLTTLVSGGLAQDNSDQFPLMVGAFPTALDLRPVFAVMGDIAGPSVCVLAGGLANVRWISLTRGADRREFLGEADVLQGGVYATSTGHSAPICVNQVGDESFAAAAGVSISGRVAGSLAWQLTSDRHRTVSAAITQGGSRTASSAGTISWSVFGAPAETVTIARASESADLTSATLELLATPAPDGIHAAVTGTFTLTTSLGSLRGEVSASATRSGATWEVAGRAEMAVDPEETGGFRATVSDPGDGAISVEWQLDSY